MTNNVFIQTIDTDFSKGRLNHVQTITLEDTAKFHGHLCDGLIVGFLGLQEVLYKLYSNGIADRTNTRLVSKSSPCITDVGIYLTGGRYQFDTFYVDDHIAYSYIVQRIDTGLTFGVKLKSDIKPLEIEEMGKKAIKGELSPCDLDILKKLEDDFSNKVLASHPNEIFIVDEIENFIWRPVLKNSFLKTDVVNKNMSLCKPDINQ